MYFVYVLKSQKNGKHYIGYTENIEKRLSIHNSGKVRSTKAFIPYSIIYTETYLNKTDAIKRELFLKSGKGREYLKSKLPI